MILDTNAVSALLAGDSALGRVLAVTNKHHLPLTVTGEYLFGLMASNKRGALEPIFEQLETESIILFPNRETAVHYAEIRHALRQLGTPIPENDVWIAALAVQHSLQIVSRDPHFDHVHDVQRIAW